MCASTPPSCLADVFLAAVQENANAPLLIEAETGISLTYAEALARARGWVALAASRGVGVGDGVALILPNRPVTVLIILAAALGGWRLVPLSPHDAVDSLAKLVRHSEVKWVLAESNTLARLGPLSDIAGWDVDAPSPPAWEAPVQALFDPEMDGLVVYTSGTTGARKGATFTHRQLLAFAKNAAAYHELTAEDRLLCVMPLYHSNALGSLFGVIQSRSSIVLPRRFEPREWWEWVVRYRCTWLPLVPAMVTQLLRSEVQPPKDVRRHVRFVKSSSAYLSDIDHETFERRFVLLLVQGMGVTEAGFVFLNPLSRHERRLGSVGRAKAFEVRVSASDGTVLDVGEAGVLSIRGSSVMRGFWKDAALTQQTLASNGWLKTGDRAIIDANGFVRLVAREVDVINKGGTKIAPQEIEAVLTSHPAVAAAAAVGIVDLILGEDAVAFVELVSPVDMAELHRHCVEQLGGLRAPRQILVVAQLPRNTLGKVLRQELRSQWGEQSSVGVQVANVELATLSDIWRVALRSAVGPETHFFDAGGHSLRAIEMLSELRVATGIEAPLSSVYDHPTLTDFHRYLMGGGSDVALRSKLPPNVVRLSSGPGAGASPNVFCLYSGQRCRPLAQSLDTAAVLYAVTTPGVVDYVAERSDALPRCVEDLAREHVAAIRAIQPLGPYCLMGFSFGGRVALEAARQLRAAGELVPILAVIDVVLAGSLRHQWLGWLWIHGRRIVGGGRRYLRQAWRMRRQRVGRQRPMERDDTLSRHLQREAYLRRVLRHSHSPAPYDGPIVLFQAMEDPEGYVAERGLGWQSVNPDVEVHFVPGHHQTVLEPPNVDALARLMLRHLENMRGSDPAPSPLEVRAS